MLASAAAGISTDQMKWRHRLLVVSAPRADDPSLALQRRALATWSGGLQDRDVTVVDVIGGKTSGVSDDARRLRERYHLPSDSFAVVLIGKDGHEALRSYRPLDGRDLAAAIDAMPMRRAGQR